MSVKFQAPEVYEHFISLKSLFIFYKYVLSNHQLCLPDKKRVKIKETECVTIVFHFFVVKFLIRYCSTGVGALYVRKRPRVRLDPIINGGGQERGLRSGTVPSPLVVGLGAACSICKQEMDVRISARNYLKILGNETFWFCTK